MAKYTDKELRTLIKLKFPRFSLANTEAVISMLNILIENTNEKILANQELNGTNYVMVYGTGTELENGIEFANAYDAAKTMPRYLGSLSTANPISYNVYKGQTFYDTENEDYYICHTNYTANVGSLNDKSIAIVESKAKSTHTTIIVAPGAYEFARPFIHNADNVNIVSLTGNRDVIFKSTNGTGAILVATPTTYIKGINTLTSGFSVIGGLGNIVIENCKGGDNSFGQYEESLMGTFIDCEAGNNSFGIGDGELINCKFIRCKAGNNSFGYECNMQSTVIDCEAGNNSFGSSPLNGYANTSTYIRCIAGVDSFGAYGTLTGEIINCKLTSGTFTTPTGAGKIYNSIDGNGTLVNYPVIQTATSKRLILSVTQTGVDAPTYTVLHNDFGSISHATYIGVGRYSIFFVANELTNLSKSFIKQNMTLLQSDGAGVPFYIYGNLTANCINLDTLTNSVYTNELLDNTIIEVEMITI